MIDLSVRLTAIEPLRRRAGLFGQIGPVLWVWVSRMGLAMLVAGVSSALAVWLGAGRIPDAVLIPLVALLSMGPVLAGLALALRSTFQTIGGRDEASQAYRERLVADVVQPLVEQATPAATFDPSHDFDLAQVWKSGVFPDTGGSQHRAQMRVSGTDGAGWQATPVRIWRVTDAHSPTNTTRTRTEVIFDGLFVRSAFPTGLRRQVVVADRTAGEQIRMKHRPVAALFGRLPDAPATGDPAFDRHLVSLTDDPDDLAAITPDLRRALVETAEHVGSPVRIAVNAEGVALAFPDRGRFREASASETFDGPLARKSESQVVAEMTTRFGVDADLLRKIPEVVRTFHRALEPNQARTR